MDPWLPSAIGRTPSAHDPNGTLGPTWLPAAAGSQEEEQQSRAVDAMTEEPDFFSRFDEVPQAEQERCALGLQGCSISSADIAVW